MRKKKWQCGVCGHIQEFEKTICEYCGVDLLMSANKKILFVEEPDPFDAEKARQKAEEERIFAEAERRRKEEARKRAEAQRRREEAQRQQAEEERRKAEAERKRAEEQRRREEAQRRQAEEERRRAEEERRRAEAERKGKEKAEQLRREQEEKRLAQEAEQAAKEAEKRRKKEEQLQKKVNRRKQKKEEKSDKPKKSIGKRIGKLLRNILIAVLVMLLVFYFIGINAQEEQDDKGNTVTTGVLSGNKVSGKCGNNVNWEMDLDTGEMVLSGRGPMYDYDHTEGITTTPWEDYRDQIKTLSVGDSITNLGGWSFSYCPNLTYVHLGNSVKQLSTGVFENSGVKNINLDEGIELINDNAFFGTALTDVTLPASLDYLGRLSFHYCKDLSSVTFQGQRTRIDFDTWDQPMFSTDSWEVPENLVLRAPSNSMVEEYARIMGYTFQSTGTGDWEATGKCGEQLDWYFDKDAGFLKITGTGAMWNFAGDDPGRPTPGRQYAPWVDYNEKIYAVSIGDGVTSIGEFAFPHCINLCDVHFGTGVETIAFQAFSGSGLDELVLPENVKKMEGFSFNSIQTLRRVQLPVSLKVLEGQTFNGCHNIEEIYIGRDTRIDDDWWTPFNHDVQPEMPENLTIYGLQNSDAERFAGDVNVPFVIGYKGMGAESEGQCGNDAWWFIDQDTQTLVLYGTGETWIYHAPKEEQYWPTGDEWLYRKGLQEGTIFTNPPEFYHRRAYISRLIVVPGLSTLSDNLMREINLDYVDLGTVKKLGLGVFSDSDLQEITIPESVELIRGFAFARCPLLNEVTILGNTRMELCVFYADPLLRQVYFGKQVRIQDDSYGDLFNQKDIEKVNPPIDKLMFYVTKGSDAERYAKQYGIHYEYYK